MKGKVIRGSAQSSERYTIAVPFITTPRPFAIDDAQPPLDDAFAAFVGDYAQPLPDEPDESSNIDLDALRAQSQELIESAARSAETLVQEASEKAQALLDDAERQAVLIADEARRSAYDEGYAAGVQSAEAQMASMLDALRDVLEATRSERHKLIGSAEPELVRLAIGIAERVLHQQVALDNGVVVEMTRAAIARIVDRERITVRVNPADLDRMRQHRDELLALGDVKTMRVIEDQRVDRGGVIVETDAGSIDAKISTQLNEVRKILHIVDDVVVAPSPLPPLAEPPELAARAS